MTATNHALTGAVIALAVKQPVLAIPLAFLSHFLCDAVPHFEARDLPRHWPMRFIGADLGISHLLAICLPFILISDVSAWTIFLCMIAAMSPDYVWCWRYITIKNKAKVFTEPMSSFSRFHKKIQHESLRTGLIEVVWLVGAIVSLDILAS